MRRALKASCVWLLLAVLLGGAPLARASVCTDAACAEVGMPLTAVDSTRSALLNAVMGSLLGSSLSLQAADWQNMTAVQVNLQDILTALQTQLSIGTPTAALDTSVTAQQLFAALASALTAEGQAAAAASVQKVAAKLGTGSLRLADLVSACSTCIAYANVKLNTMDLVTGLVSLFNYQNTTGVPTPMTITGSAVGLTALGTVSLYAQVAQAPLIVCNSAVASFNGAAIRLKLDCALASVDITSALNAQLSALGITISASVTGLAVQLTHLTVYADLAKAVGTLQSVDAVNQVVRLQATPGTVNIYVGTMNDSTFFTRSHTVTNSDLSPGTVGAMQLTVLGVPITASIAAQAYASGQSPSAATLTASGAFPQTQINSTSAFYVSNLVTALVSNLSIQINVNNTGLLSPVLSLLTTTLTNIQGALTTVIGTTFSPLLTSVLSSLVNPMLTLFGVQLGDIDVTVLGAHHTCTYTLSGSVYQDSNRNGFKDGAEAGTGLTLYAKLVSVTAPLGPALQAVAVDPAAGAYAFSGVSPGSYAIILSANSTLSDVSAMAVPSGWMAIEQPGLVRTPVVVVSDLPNLNFGLAPGTTIAGKVFVDTGTAGGTANDGVMNGGEAGLAGVTVKLLNAANTVLSTATTGADGSYTLVIPSTVLAGAALQVVKTTPAGYVASGASVGTTAGIYVRTTDTVTLAAVLALNYTGLNFGVIPQTVLATDGLQTALAGSAVTFPHVFTAGSAGSVVFSTSHTLTPAVAGWSEVLYLDSNGNGQLDPGEPIVGGAMNVTAGQVVNLIVKVFVPAAAPFNAQDQVVLTATLTAAGASPALVSTCSRTDLVTAGATGTAGLALTKTVDKATAKPGDSLTYTITFVNTSSSPISNVQIFDATPGFTQFVSAAVGTIPAALGTVTLTAPAAGAVGSISWSFSGTLAPGAAGSVVFVVAVQL